MRHSSQTLLTIKGKYLFIEVDIQELEGIIKIRDYYNGAAPVKIVNLLDCTLYYGQKGVTDWKIDRHIKKLPHRKSVYFIWIDPAKTRELVYKLSLNPNDSDEEKSVNIDFDKCFLVENSYGWVSFLDGKQRILLFTKDLKLPQYLLRVIFNLTFLLFSKKK